MQGRAGDVAEVGVADDAVWGELALVLALPEEGNSEVCSGES